VPPPLPALSAAALNDATLSEAFHAADEVLHAGVRGISDIITVSVWLQCVRLKRCGGGAAVSSSVSSAGWAA
jgi:hypothetical protein